MFNSIFNFKTYTEVSFLYISSMTHHWLPLVRPLVAFKSPYLYDLKACGWSEPNERTAILTTFARRRRFHRMAVFMVPSFSVCHWQKTFQAGIEVGLWVQCLPDTDLGNRGYFGVLTSVVSPIYVEKKRSPFCK